jgi:uridine kinase
MHGDTILIEDYHRRTAQAILEMIKPKIEAENARYTISVAGESGSGKSETAAAIAEALNNIGIHSIILQQDDYFVYPPMTNDAERRKDISWVGTQEVKLDLMDENLKDFRDHKAEITKPLVIYKEDKVVEETVSFGDSHVAIAEGTYTSLLKNINLHIFIDRTHQDTLEHRQKRSRHESELDPFIDKVLEIEHQVISKQRDLADIILTKDYSVLVV